MFETGNGTMISFCDYAILQFIAKFKYNFIFFETEKTKSVTIYNFSKGKKIFKFEFLLQQSTTFNFANDIRKLMSSEIGFKTSYIDLNTNIFM